MKDNKEVLQAKLRSLKAENMKFVQLMQSNRVSQDILSHKLIESQREVKGNTMFLLINSLAEEIERQ